MFQQQEENGQSSNNPSSGKQLPEDSINSGYSEKESAPGNENSDATMLQFSPRKTGGHNAKTSEVRNRFLHAYEQTFGNISASCEYAGIDRRTYYRWMKSDSRVNKKFQTSIALIKPVDRQLDLAEAMLMKRVLEGDMRAIELVLKTRGKTRGYDEKNSDRDQQLVIRAVNRIEMVIEVQKSKNPDFKPDVNRFIELAAKDYGISAEDLEKEMIRRKTTSSS